MNRSDLLSTVQHELAKSIESMVTEYMRNHPEYFRNCMYSSGLICSFEITLSYQPERLNEVATVKPCVFVRLAGAEYGEECNRFSHHPEHLYHTTWVGKKRTAEKQEDF